MVHDGAKLRQLNISFRPADIGDAQAIADCHVKVWKHTYKELAPAEVHATLDERHRGEKWREKLGSDNDPDQLVLIAMCSDRIVGIGAAGRPSERIFSERGEIKYLYVDPDFKRRGIRRELLARLARHLKMRKYEAAALSVVKGNQSAIAFYEALEGRYLGDFIDPGPVWRSHNLVYVWDDITKLT